MNNSSRYPSVWLWAGLTLLGLGQMRYGVGVLAWLAPVALLHHVRRRPGWRSGLLFVGASAAAYSVICAKIITAPLPLAFAAAYGVPLGVILALPYLGWSFVRRRLGETAGTLSFPTLLVCAEWVLHGLLPLGTWGALANTQLDQLALLQLASITGIHGVSAVMALTAAVVERLWAGERSSVRPAALSSALGLLAIMAFGQARLTIGNSRGQPTRRVAAVGTDSVVGTQPELPDATRLRQVEQGLVARTELAAAGGADLVVWTEAATMVRPADEPSFLRRLGAMSARLHIDLVAAYVVPVSEAPLRYENKYVFLRKDGGLDHQYLKREPVPAEPAVRGTQPAELVGTPGQGAVSGAICYDYDFPYLGRAHAQLAADIVALPSSDWRGIDPIHTEMAMLRAIEGGHSIVRSTRFGLSAAIDPYGRMRALSSHFDGQRRVLIADVPLAGTTTPYGRLGEWFPALCLLSSLALAAAASRRRAMLPSPHDEHGTVGRFEGSSQRL